MEKVPAKRSLVFWPSQGISLEAWMMEIGEQNFPPLWMQRVKHGQEGIVHTRHAYKVLVLNETWKMCIHIAICIDVMSQPKHMWSMRNYSDWNIPLATRSAWVRTPNSTFSLEASCRLNCCFPLKSAQVKLCMARFPERFNINFSEVDPPCLSSSLNEVILWKCLA